jgi:hypothetical protein
MVASCRLTCRQWPAAEAVSAEHAIIQPVASLQQATDEKDDQMDQNDQSDDVRRHYSVRQVTDYQASWVEDARGEDGTFTLQLILDNGVEEYILEPTEDDLDVILKLLSKSKRTTFDLDRKVLMFSNLSA